MKTAIIDITAAGNNVILAGIPVGGGHITYKEVTI
jgi:uncharacterized protein (DUF1786 family)